MTITGRPRHAVVFAALFLCQAVGVWGLIHAGVIEVSADGFTLRAPVHFKCLFLCAYTPSPALLTTLLMVHLHDTVFPEELPRNAAVVRFLVWCSYAFSSVSSCGI